MKNREVMLAVLTAKLLELYFYTDYGCLGKREYIEADTAIARQDANEILDMIEGLL